MTYKPWLPVWFQDRPLWVRPEVFDGEDGPIAPDDQIKDGHLTFMSAFFGDSFAKISDGEIIRFGEVIGYVADLKPRELPVTP